MDRQSPILGRDNMGVVLPENDPLAFSTSDRALNLSWIQYKRYTGTSPRKYINKNLLNNDGFLELQIQNQKLNSLKNNKELLDDVYIKEDVTINKSCLKRSNFLNIKEISVTFNIGPSFVHMSSINNITGNRFNYLFNTYNNTRPVINKYQQKINNKVFKNKTNTNTLLKLNIYNDNCTCSKCLIDSYIFIGNQSIELYMELLDILKMDYCKHWDLEWIKLLILQLNLFFSCYKDGIFYERLLESASLCAKMLLVRNNKLELLEFKYSYLYFLNNLLYFYNNNNNNKNAKNNNNKKMSTKLLTTGKEKLEFIDGIKFLTFRTEKDMAEYTNLEINYLNKIKLINNNINNNNITILQQNYNNDNEIIPTKTTDITKIKGWRNKLFTSYNKTVKINENNNFDNKINDNNNCKKISNNNNNVIDTEDVTKQILEEMAANFLNNQIITEVKNQIKIEEIPQPLIKMENLDENISNFQENSIETKIESQEETQTETTDKTTDGNKVKNSVFESDALDEYLKNNSTLNISYEIPTLHAAETLKNKQNSPEEPVPVQLITLKQETQSDEDNKIIDLKPFSLDEIPETTPDVRDFEEITIKHETLEMNSSPTDTVQPSKVIRGLHRSSQNNNLRYIWVQGRPIQVVNGINDDDMITKNEKNLKQSQLTTSRILVKRSKESQTEFNNQENKENIQNNTNLDQEDVFEVDIKRPRLLTNVSDIENDCLPKQFEVPNNCVPSIIPVLHNCKENSYKCNCKYFSLGMVLIIGKNRYLNKIAVDNLALLSENDKLISERMATIAASAVCTNQKSKLTRIVVPVVSSKIVNAVKNWEQKLVYDRIAQTIPASFGSEDIDPEIREVVDRLLNYAELKLESSDIPYDPLYVPKPSESPKKVKKEKQPKSNSKIVRELRRLINVSIIDESNTNSIKIETRNNCGNEHCIKGCICNSLNNKLQFPLHCGRIACMFDCTCNNREIYENNVLKADQMSDIILAKEEMTWHQTVIRSEDRVEIMNPVDKTKREKKLPTRFRNNVLLGREMCPTVATPEITEQETATPEPQQKHEFKPYSNLRGESIKKQIIKRRLAFCADTIKSRRTLADVFIWCGIHDKYNCLCVSWICRLKNNAFIWRPEKTTRYLPHKLMTEMALNPEYSNEVYLYDTKRYAARTYGTPIEYNVRNRSETFLTKRKCELENNVISCTNSYIKMKLFMVKDKYGRKEKKPLSDFDKKEVYKSSTVQNVYIKPETENNVEIDILDRLPPVPIVSVRIEVDSDSDTEDIKGQKFPEGITVKHGHSSILEKSPNEIVVQIQTDDRKEFRKGITLPAMPIKPSMKPPIKSYSRNIKCDKNLSTTELPAKKFDPDKRKLSQIETDNSIPVQNDNFDKILIKKKRLSCPATVSSSDDMKEKSASLLASHLPFKDKIDAELEGELIRLEEHPLKNDMYAADNLPKLALLCLTPGIGYLPIVEFTQEVLAVQDPVFPELYHSFRNLDSANLWLNKFFKNRLIFETIDTTLKWVIVKPGIIKLKRSPPFSPALLENPSIIVTRDGGLIFKKKDHNTGGICRGAIKVEPLSLTGNNQLAIIVKEPTENKRKVANSTEKIVDICDSDGKRRKIQLETVPMNEQIVKRPINLFRQFPSMKLQDPIQNISPSTNSNTLTSATITHAQINNFTNTAVQPHPGGTTTTTFLQSSGNSPAFLRLNVDGVEKKCPTLHINSATPVLKSTTIRPLLVSGTTNTPIRLQVSPTGLTNLCPRTVLPNRSLSPPPLAIRSDVVQQSPGMLSSVPFSGSKIISHDGRPVIIHNNTIIPINFKTHHYNKHKQKTP